MPRQGRETCRDRERREEPAGHRPYHQPRADLPEHDLQLLYRTSKVRVLGLALGHPHLLLQLAPGRAERFADGERGMRGDGFSGRSESLE